MSYRIISLPHFDKEFKRLAKRYHSLKGDLAILVKELADDPQMGTMISKGCYKIRIAIKSKGKGKRGGGRIITYIIIPHETIFLLSIYDKSEKDNITNNELAELITLTGL